MLHSIEFPVFTNTLEYKIVYYFPSFSIDATRWKKKKREKNFWCEMSTNLGEKVDRRKEQEVGRRGRGFYRLRKCQTPVE